MFPPVVAAPAEEAVPPQESAVEPAVERVPAPPRADEDAGLRLLLLRSGREADGEAAVRRPGDGGNPRREADLGARFSRSGREEIVEPPPRDSERRRRETKRYGGPARQVDGPLLDAFGAGGLDRGARADALEGGERVAREELAADLGPRKTVLLEQEDPPARGREHGRRRGSRGARADDDRVPRRHAPGPVISIR